MLRWLARLSLPKALALALVWPIVVLLAGLLAVAWFLLDQVHADKSYMVSFVPDPLLSIVLWGPPLLVLVAWALARRRFRSAT